MKKINFLFIVLALVFTACSSDDDNTPSNTSEALLGTWIGQDVDYTGTTSTTVEGQNIEASFVGEGYDVDYTLSFTENPNEVVSDGSYSIALTTTIMGQTQTENIEDMEFLETDTWSQAGDQLTIVNGDDATTATIIELTATTLKLGISETKVLEHEG